MIKSDGTYRFYDEATSTTEIGVYEFNEPTIFFMGGALSQGKATMSGSSMSVVNQNTPVVAGANFEVYIKM